MYPVVAKFGQAASEAPKATSFIMKSSLMDELNAMLEMQTQADGPPKFG